MKIVTQIKRIIFLPQIIKCVSDVGKIEYQYSVFVVLFFWGGREQKYLEKIHAKNPVTKFVTKIPVTKFVTKNAGFGFFFPASRARGELEKKTKSGVLIIKGILLQDLNVGNTILIKEIILIKGTNILLKRCTILIKGTLLLQYF